MYDNAAQAYHGLLQVDPWDSFFWKALADVRIIQGQCKDAHLSYKNAIEGEPDIFTSLGLCLYECGEFDEAIRTGNEAFSGGVQYLVEVYRRRKPGEERLRQGY